MHYLIGFIGLSVAFWLLRKLKQRVVRLFRPTLQPQPRPPGPEIAAAIQGPKHKTARYVTIALLTFAVGWFFRDLLLPEHQSPKPSGIVAITAPPKSPEPSGNVAITAPLKSSKPESPKPSIVVINAPTKPPEPSESLTMTAPPKSLEPSDSLTVTAPILEAPRPSEGGCEWVKSYTREDATSVSGHWSRKPGYTGECPLPPKKPCIVGPRGGRFTISKNGKKVYEQRCR
jgi:hypothetical protein